MISDTRIKTYVVFDLDDTLYKEVDFVRSAFQHIASVVAPDVGRNVAADMWSVFQHGGNAIDWLFDEFDLRFTVDQIVSEYRFHQPVIQLEPGAKQLLGYFTESGVPIGLITDGRKKTQTQKLTALGISGLFDYVVISEEFGTEKPAIENYKVFEDRCPDAKFCYVGDNFQKDFVTPKRMGWKTVGLLDDGRNIHKQDFGIQEEYRPSALIKSLPDLVSNLGF